MPREVQGVVKNYEIGKHQIELIDNPDVWQPHAPTIRFISTLDNPEFIEDSVRGRDILEVGTGSGIVGIFLLQEGANSVVMTDINDSALSNAAQNLELNGITDKRRYRLMDAYVFMGIIRFFNTIISNPPVQPHIADAHLNNKAAKYNETEDGGTRVLHSLIKYGREYLNEDGVLITSCSSRHGHRQTEELLNKYWGEGNWEIILDEEYEITPDYHGPYMEYWIEQQLRDGDLRVYCKDEQGNSYTPDHYDPSLKWYFRYIVIKAIKRKIQPLEA